MNNPTSKCKPTERKASKSRNDDGEMVREFFLADCAGNILKAVSEMIGKQDVESLLRVESTISEIPGYERAPY